MLTLLKELFSSRQPRDGASTGTRGKDLLNVPSPTTLNPPTGSADRPLPVEQHVVEAYASDWLEPTVEVFTDEGGRPQLRLCFFLRLRHGYMPRGAERVTPPLDGVLYRGSKALSTILMVDDQVFSSHQIQYHVVETFTGEMRFSFQVALNEPISDSPKVRLRWATADDRIRYVIC